MQSRKKIPGFLVIALFLLLALVACQPAPRSVPTEEIATVPATSTTLPTTPIATVTRMPTATPISANATYLIAVTAMQDRPDEIPQLPPREDGFAQSEPWEIAEAFHPADGMRFLALEVTALNISEDLWRFNGARLVLTDETGKGFPAQLGRTAMSMASFDLRYSQKARGWVVFEIPVEAVPQEIMLPLEKRTWIVSPIDALVEFPDISLQTTSETNIPASNLILDLLAVKDPGSPFSTFAYTYIAGYRPVNIEIEISNQSDETVAFYPHRFTLMDTSGTLHLNQPGGASNAIDGDDLGPGETRRGELSFDLPQGENPSQLIYTILPNTDQVLQISVRP